MHGEPASRRAINRDQTRVMAELQGIQSRHGYLPRHELEALASNLGMTAMQVFSLATFYKSFHLEPRGKHCIRVCMGTACHVQGAPLLMEALESRTGASAGGTSPDRLFSLESVRCVGACSMAPVVIVGEDTYGRVRQRDVRRILRKYGSKQAAAEETE